MEHGALRLTLRASVVLLVCLGSACGQLSNPIAVDAQIDGKGNKFLQRRATNDDRLPSSDDEVDQTGDCAVDVSLKWMTEVSSSIYATPLIHDLYSDGHKDIIVPSFVHYLEVVEGSNGAKASEDGWPAFHKSTVHTSPLAFDFDFDNVLDILIATYDGEILAFKDTGEQLPDVLVVPRLRIHKDWFVGLAADFIDHSNPDVGNSPEGIALRRDNKDGTPTVSMEDGNATSFDRLGRRRLLQEPARGSSSLSEDATSSFEELFSEADGEAQDHQQDRLAGRAETYELPQYTQTVEEMAGVDEAKWESMAHESVHDRYDGRYGDYHVEPSWSSLHDHAWADEMYFAAPHKQDKGFVAVDSHILCTPAIGDIDADGQPDLVVAASYFFDRDYYSQPENKKELGSDIDTAKYIAGAISVFELRTRKLKWTQHLDLSTDHTQYRAYIYSAPTLSDVDGDGKLEIIVGTSMGFLYVLDHRGRTLEGWPLQMGEIQAQVAVADLRGDGSLCIVAADARGNVAAFDAAGNEIWERHLGTLIAQAPSFADVNGDGLLEVVLGGTNGGLYALSSATGQDIASFPVYTKGRIMAPVLPTRITAGAALQLIAPSYDGHLYIVNGITGCSHTIDIGETAYAMVLADDLDGDGLLDLLLATMNGNLYAFQTAMPASPHLTWPSQVLGRSGFTSKLSQLSVAATPASRQPRDVPKQELGIRFEILDQRVKDLSSSLGPYTVFVTLQGVGTAEMKAGHEPVIGVTDKYAAPGVYTLQVPCPRARSSATVQIELQDKSGQLVTDTFSLSFHMHFHRLLKWILAGPFAVACLTILAQHAEGGLGLSLPSTQ